MKVIFWISSLIVLIAEGFTIQGFVNVYFKNYNGGSQSSSGSILYTMLFGLLLIGAGFFAYFTGKIKLAAAIMGVPILLVILYLFFMLILPYLMGERMN